MIINVRKVTNRTKLLFSEKGVELRNKIIFQFNEDDKKGLIKIDLSDIEIIDASFIREAFIKLIGIFRTELEKPQVLFENVNDHIKQNMEESFSFRNMFALVHNSKGNYELIGKFSQQLSETVNIMLKVNEITAKQITKEIDNLELTSANNRLKNLYDMCVIYRKEVGQESGGKEYVYNLRK